MSLIEEIKQIVKEYDELQVQREEELAEFKDEEGEVTDWYSYDSRRTEQDEADAEQYGFVMARLARLIEEAGE